MIPLRPLLLSLCLASPVMAEDRAVYLETVDGERTHVATLTLDGDGGYDIRYVPEVFTDHFLSMRPFKCIEGPTKQWCHVPYPYEIKRSLSDDLTDLEYDLLFVWKGAGEYGIDMWNGVYYRLTETDGAITGALYEMDMDILAVPPDPGVLRPIRETHLEEGDPDSHWLPKVVVE